jgi:hypothetical protein
MWMYLAVGAGFVVALNLPLVVAARAVARNRERTRDELGPRRRAQLEQYLRT